VPVSALSLSGDCIDFLLRPDGDKFDGVIVEVNYILSVSPRERTVDIPGSSECNSVLSTDKSRWAKAVIASGILLSVDGIRPNGKTALFRNATAKPRNI
jgi:hypothetical protein